MKKLLVSLATLISMVAITITPLSAAPAEDMEWQIASFNKNGNASAYVYVNPNNLSISELKIVNGTTTEMAIFRVFDTSGSYPWPVIFEVSVLPGETYIFQVPGNLKYYRTPKNDPDDPDSVRMPKNISFSFGN